MCTDVTLSPESFFSVLAETKDNVSISSSKFSSQIVKVHESIDKFKQIQEALSNAATNCLEDKNRLTFLVADILAKSFAYQRPTLDVTEITIPQLINREIRCVKFSFAAMDLGHLSIAHILLPKDQLAQPLIVFRGTVPTSFETLQSTFGFRGTLSLFENNTWGFGNNVLRDNRKIFPKVLREIKDQYSAPVLIGHSLGGALAQRLALQGNNIDLISSIFAFNAPGILSSECKKYSDMSQPKKDKIFIINAEDDPIVNHFGSRRFIGRKFIFKPFEGFKELAHGIVILDKAGKFTELKPKFATLAKKIGVIVFYPFRAIGVVFLLINAFIFVDIPAFIYNKFFCEDAYLRRKAPPLKIGSTSLLDQIFRNSEIWWSLPNPQQG